MRSSNRLGVVIAVVTVTALVPGTGASSLSATWRQETLGDRQAFLGDAEVAGVTLSPNGLLIAFTRPEQGVAHLWLGVRGLPIEAAVRLTQGDGPVREVTWSRDSRYVVFTRATADGGSHVFAAAADTTRPDAPRDLTPLAGVSARLYPAPDSMPDVVMVGLGPQASGRYDVYRIDVTTGERTLVARNPGDVTEWVVDRQGAVGLAVRRGPTGGTELLRRRGDTLTSVYACDPGEICRPLRYHGDGNRVYLATSHGRSATELTLFNPGTFEEDLVDRDPEGRRGLGEVVFSPVPGQDLLATAYYDDSTRVYAKDETFGRDLGRLRERLGDGTLHFESVSADGVQWIVRTDDPAGPDAWFLFNRWTGAVDTVAVARPRLAGVATASSRPVRIPARDGATITGRLTLPREGAAALPAIVLAPGAREEFGPGRLAWFLANRGYAVLELDYRDHPGGLPAFLSPDDIPWLAPTIITDVIDAARYAGASGWADPTRIGVMGIGFSGFAALGAAAEADAGLSAVAALGPVTDLPALADYASGEDGVLVGAAVQLGDVDAPDRQMQLAARSPVGRAAAVSAPVMLLHGSADRVIPATQSREMAAALHGAGRSVRLSEIRGAGYRLDGVARSAAGAAVEGFFGEHLGGGQQEVVAMVRLQDVSAAAPADVDGERLREEKLRYRVTTEDGLETELTRVIDRRRIEGVNRWRVIDETLAPVYSPLQFDTTTFAVEEPIESEFDDTPPPPDEMIPAADTVDLDLRTLQPVRRGAGGVMFVDLRFASDRVTGEVTAFDFTDDVDVPLEQPVYADGPSIDVVIAALPLTEGYQTTLRVFDAQWQDVVTYAVAVGPRETVRTVAGAFDTYRVEMTPIDADGEVRTVNVLAEAPHHVVRLVTIPVGERGATQTVELVERSR